MQQQQQSKCCSISQERAREADLGSGRKSLVVVWRREFSESNLGVLRVWLLS